MFVGVGVAVAVAVAVAVGVTVAVAVGVGDPVGQMTAVPQTLSFSALATVVEPL